MGLRQEEAVSGVRRTGRGLVTAFLVLAACTGPSDSPGDARELASRDAPNVLIILTDDQRADSLEVMPDTSRYFKDGGTQFPQAFATTPLCCPFRAAMFSGRYAHNNGVRLNTDGFKLDQEATMQRYLQDAGYSTGITGKFLNRWPIDDAPPHFDEWAIFSPNVENRAYVNVEFNVDGEVDIVPQYSTGFIEDQAVRMLNDFETDDDRPWLLFVTPFAPHTPFLPEPKYANAPVPEWSSNPAVGESDRRDKPQFIQERLFSPKEGLEVRTKQLRTLMSVDDLVERVMGRLEALGENENTMAFYMSDNGYLWGEHGAVEKKLPYTPSINIPFYLRWPRAFEPGTISDRFVTTVDIAPTILDAASVDLPRDPVMDGTSLLADDPGALALVEHWRNNQVRTAPTWASLRTTRYQYIEYYDRDEDTIIFSEYYDLTDDPFQLVNLLGDDDATNDPSPRLVERLGDRLEALRTCAGPVACP